MSRPKPTADFDHLDASLLRGSSATYAGLRTHCPVLRSQRHGGFVALTRYDDVRSAALLVDHFSSAAISVPGEPGDSIPIMLDPPMHTGYRAMLASFFSSRRARDLEPDLRRLTSDLIDRFAPRGSCDLSSEVTQIVPTITLARLLGLTDDGSTRFVELIDTLIYHPGDEPTAERDLADLGSLLRDHVVRRRRDRAGADSDDDLVGFLLAQRIDDRPIPTSTIVNMAVTLAFGGLGPVTFLLNGALLHLDDDATLRERLLDRPNARALATEEFLRYLSPVQSIGRVVVEPVTRFGEDFCSGERVLLLWGSANRDAARFDDADSFIADRKPNPHLAFGAGVHRCLGATLARVQFRAVLDVVLERLPGYRVEPRSAITHLAGHMSGITRLPVTFTPTAPLPR